ncbi:MAG: hypothetical protein ACPG5U_08630 [Planktomarina sp.]
MKRCLTILLFTLLTVGVMEPAQAQDVGGQQLETAIRLVQSVDDLETLVTTCPADIRYTRQTWRDWLLGNRFEWTLSQCRANLERCATACTTGHVGSACRATARAFEQELDNENRMPSRQAYTLACASGNALACTNRAAGLRNTPVDTDPLSVNQPAAFQTCLTRTFEGSCHDDDAWGCAMYAQALMNGQGTKQDTDQAQSIVRKACRLSTNEVDKGTISAPCRFARRLFQ